MFSFSPFVSGFVSRVIAAASFSPSETQRPKQQSLTHYSFNFRRQERALRNMDFPKGERKQRRKRLISEQTLSLKLICRSAAEEDVPEEEATEAETTEQKHYDTSIIQTLRPEPDPGIIPALRSSVRADPGLLRVSSGADLQTESVNFDLSSRGTGEQKNQKEEEEEQEEEEEEKRCEAPDPVKEENRSEEQDSGLNTLQVQTPQHSI